jgi:hypothetical protein
VVEDPVWETELPLSDDGGWVRIPSFLRGSVDFCSFGQVFSHNPRCWECGNHRGHHITLSVWRKPPSI